MLPVRLIFATVSACGLHFWPSRPQLDPRPLLPQFLTFRASSQPAALIHSAAA